MVFADQHRAHVMRQRYDLSTIGYLLLFLAAVWLLFSWLSRSLVRMSAAILFGLGLAGAVIGWLALRAAYCGLRDYLGRQVSLPASVERKWVRDYLDTTRAAPGGQIGALVEQDMMGASPSLIPGWGGGYLIQHLWVSFRTSRGEEELLVPEKVYVELEEGDEGILTFRGERFISFRKLRRAAG